MQKIRTLFITLCLTLLLPLCSVYSATIQGKVTDCKTRQLMSEIVVTLQTTPPQSAITDKNGFYKFIDIPAGTYVVEISLPEGYVASTPSTMNVKVNGNVHNVHFSIGKPGSLKGKVTDADSLLPLSGVYVDLIRGGNTIASVMTDAEGCYFIENLAPRAYLINVRMPYFSTDLELVQIIPETVVTMNFNIEIPASFEGQIVTQNNNTPVKDAKVEIFHEGNALKSEQTNEEGKYGFTNIAPGHYLVKVTGTQYVIEEQEIILVKSEHKIMNFSLKTAGKIFGHIYHSFTQEPLANAHVSFRQDDHETASCTSDENGYYAICAVGSGDLVVEQSHFHSTEQKVSIEYDEQLELNFNIVCLEPSPSRNISCKVYHKRNGLSNCYVHILQWKASADPQVVSYKIFCEQKLIGEVAANKKLELVINTRKKNRKYTIIAVNQFGQYSDPCVITSRENKLKESRH